LGASSDVELLARVVRNPGRLVMSPGSTSGAFPYGGTSLGLTRGGELVVDVRYAENRDPASGAVNEIARRTVETPRLVFVVEGPSWDEDLVAAAFSRTVSLPTQSPPDVRAEGTLLPGVVQATSPILFAADDPKGKSVYFKRPLVIVHLGLPVPFSWRKAGLPIVIVPSPHSGATSGHWQIARLGNLVL
jgi:hypothetical protein